MNLLDKLSSFFNLLDGQIGKAGHVLRNIFEYIVQKRVIRRGYFNSNYFWSSGVVEYWSVGVLDFFSSLQYAITPALAEIFNNFRQDVI